MKTINLSNYVVATRSRNRWYSSPSVLALTKYATGQKVAKDLNIKDMQGEKIHVEVPFNLDHAQPEFLSGLFRTLIRKQGIDKTQELVTTNTDEMEKSLNEFWTAEKAKEAEKAAKKEKQASLGQWSNQQHFFVPDIGTRVRLVQDWTFRLYAESRNFDFHSTIGVEYEPGRYRSKEEIKKKEITFKAGTVLKIDRIYVRKGVKEYSSITFNVEKGNKSVAVDNGRVHIFTKKGGRFWAKLSDVNKMIVEVDTATLSEN